MEGSSPCAGLRAEEVHPRQDALERAAQPAAQPDGHWFGWARTSLEPPSEQEATLCMQAAARRSAPDGRVCSGNPGDWGWSVQGRRPWFLYIEG